MIKCGIHKDALDDLWLLETVAVRSRDYTYEFTYRSVKRKFFFFYELEDEWITTSLYREPNLWNL